MAHKIGGEWHVPHGLANEILLPHVIRYNGKKKKKKLTTWPKYNYYCAPEKYAEICDVIGIKYKDLHDAVDKLADAVASLIKECGVDPNFSCWVKDEKAWDESLDDLAYLAFEDQCTTANPRIPMVEDMKEIMRKAYKGN